MIALYISLKFEMRVFNTHTELCAAWVNNPTGEAVADFSEKLNICRN